MKEYPCELCDKIFKQKSHWQKHTSNKKFSCIIKSNNDENNKIGGNKIEIGGNEIEIGGNGIKIGGNEIKIGGNEIKIDNNQNNVIEGDENDKIILCEEIIAKNNEEKKHCCEYCYMTFSRIDNLKRHVNEGRCRVLKIQKQQKENIFINLLEEEKIVNQTKKDMKKIIVTNKDIKKIKSTNNQMEFLMEQIKLLNSRLDEQKLESEKKQEKIKNDTESKIKMMTERYIELEKNNLELQKTNEKLQTKVNKIVNKNKITNNSNSNNNNNITTNVINNPTIKLVNFGSENLEKIPHSVFTELVKSQGAVLYNKAIEGIHFNKDYPENQNIYISDINRGKVMVYKDEKWLLDNWESIYPILLEKIIQFGYDKNEFMKDCGYKIGNIRYNKQTIKNGMRWFKLLDGDDEDIEYFTKEPDERPQIDDETYQDYLEMYNFRKRHDKKQTELNIKNKIKLNMYNKRNIPIDNYKQIENCGNDEKKLAIKL
jgi:hypothetical protein